MSDYINCAVTVNPKLLESLRNEVKILNDNLQSVRASMSAVSTKEDALVSEVSKLRMQVAELANLNQSSPPSEDFQSNDTDANSSDLIPISDAFDTFIKACPDADPKGLMTRAKNCLTRSGIYTIKDLSYLDMRRIQRIRNMGKQTLQQVLLLAKYYGVEIPDRIDDPKYPTFNEGDIALSLTEQGSIPIYTVVNIKQVYQPGRYYALPLYYCYSSSDCRAIYSVSQLGQI